MSNQDTRKDPKNWLTFSNISTTLLVLLMLAMFFSPEAKGLLIQGLMKVGFFQPDMPQISKQNATSVPGQQVLFTDVKGKTITLADQKGKVVFMNFWASWCPPCIAEMPSISSLYAKYKDHKNVIFILVDVDGNINASTAFLNKKNFTLPVYISASEIPKEYFSGSMPTTVILDKAGNIAFHHVGGADYTNPEVSSFIDKLAK